MNPGADRPLTTALGWRLPSWLVDIVPVAVIFLVGAAALIATAVRGTSRGVLLLGLVVAVSALLVRHRAPMLVLALVLVLSISLGWGPVVVLPVLLALFNVAEYSERPRVIVATIAAAAGLVVTAAVHHQTITIPSIVSRLVVIGLAVAVGLYLRARADYINGLRERAERSERERVLLAWQAVAEERVRIARELHDVVAHNVSLMVVQAQALAATGGGAEQQTALGRVADLGRDALSEMHRMLGLLRVQNGGAAEREPQPGVHELDALIGRTRQAGLDARLNVEGPTRELPAAVDLSAYRIVQEALTNVVRHAGADSVTVSLTYSPTALEVMVLDDGCGGNADGPTGGHGLVGMRERVALFGGELEAGRRRHGDGYRVHAVLPVS